MYECRVEADSITLYGERLTTIVATFPRLILAELNTTRVFSRSSASSRAIPTQKQLARVLDDPFLPVYWGKNQSGMSAAAELDGEDLALAKATWEAGVKGAMALADSLSQVGLHKQIANRVLEPYMWHTAIITATNWDNHQHLRNHAAVQPEYRVLAEMIGKALAWSTPVVLHGESYESSAWHLPFKQPGEETRELGETEGLIKKCIGRGARVSYLNHDGSYDPASDRALSSKLFESGHMAPYEHVARAMTDSERELFERDEIIANPIYQNFASLDFAAHERPGQPRFIKTGKKTYYLGNFNGFVQARKLIPYESDPLGARG